MAKREFAMRGARSGEHWRTSRQWHPASALLAVLAGLAALLAAGCSGKPVEVVETRPAMDTEVMVRVVARNEATARRALALAWAEMDLCAAKLDRYRAPSDAWLSQDPAVRGPARRDPAQAPSDVWRINREAGQWNVEVDALVTSCLTAAKEAWELSGGAFDPTVGPLVDLWRQAAARGTVPTDEEIEKARAQVGMDKIEMLVAKVQKPAEELPLVAPGAPPPGPDELSRMIQSVGVPAGMSLDLGGIAKGYIAGRMARRMEQAGALAGLVAAAGDVYAFGERPPAVAGDVYAFGKRPAAVAGKGGDPRWGVGVQDPRYPEDRARLYTAIHVSDQGVDTSGHYYRGYTIGGKRFSHIMDPRTGRPVDTRLASVTVVADDPALSDALATAIAVLGVKDGLALVEKTEGVECLLLEWTPGPGEEPQASGAPPPAAALVAHRSKGFAALEFKPSGADVAR